MKNLQINEKNAVFTEVLCIIGLLPFLANLNSRSRSLYVIARPSVFRLSVVCNVRAPYLGNISSPFGTLAIV